MSRVKEDLSPAVSRVTLRWVTNPLLRSNQKLLNRLNGIETGADTFVTPYVVEIIGESPITVHKKYIFSRGTTTEYFYEVEGLTEKLEELCSDARKLNFLPLTLTYVLPNPGKDITEEELYGLLPILKTMVRKALFGETGDTDISSMDIDRIVFERYKNPAYINFQPLQRQLLGNQYDILKEYRATLPNPLGMISTYSYYPPTDDGTYSVSPIYVSEEVFADVRSKINIKELIGYTLLHGTPMPFHIMKDWSIAHDYDQETILANMKRVGVERDVVLINNELVYKDPESIFWDLRSRSLVKEEEGWFVFRVPEVSLSENAMKVYDEIARTFQFHKRSIIESPGEVILSPPEKYRYAFGFDAKTWLEDTRTNIYAELPPMLTIEGDWSFLTQLTLTSENLAKVAYAAYRGFAEILQKNLDYATFSNMIHIYPDFSVSLPIYSLEDLKLVQETMKSVLASPQHIQAVICKTLEECVASRAQTIKDIPNSIPFSITINDQVVLVSNSNLALVKKPSDFPEEAKDLEDVDPYTPEVQGFFDLGDIKGAVEKKEESMDIDEGFIQIFDSGQRLFVNVALDPKRSFDLFSIPIPKGKKGGAIIGAIERYTEDLWRRGWFFTEWGRNKYKMDKTFSSYLIRDVQSEIKTFRDLENVVNSLPKFSEATKRA